MKGNNSNTNYTNSSELKLSIVPEDVLKSILVTQTKILDIVSNKPPTSLKDFVTEKQAMEILNKKSTWFWQMRKSGKLKSSKIGQTNYYPIEDILNLPGSK
jgi:hypothetical protein